MAESGGCGSLADGGRDEAYLASERDDIAESINRGTSTYQYYADECETREHSPFFKFNTMPPLPPETEDERIERLEGDCHVLPRSWTPLNRAEQFEAMKGLSDEAE